MIQRQMTMKVCNVRKLHRPRMSAGFLADSVAAVFHAMLRRARLCHRKSSVRDVSFMQVGIFENNFTAEQLKIPAHTDPNMGNLDQREPPKLGWNRGRVRRAAIGQKVNWQNMAVCNAYYAYSIRCNRHHQLFSKVFIWVQPFQARVGLKPQDKYTPDYNEVVCDFCRRQLRVSWQESSKRHLYDYCKWHLLVLTLGSSLSSII